RRIFILAGMTLFAACGQINEALRDVNPGGVLGRVGGGGGGDTDDYRYWTSPPPPVYSLTGEHYSGCAELQEEVAGLLQKRQLELRKQREVARHNSRGKSSRGSVVMDSSAPSAMPEALETDVQDDSAAMAPAGDGAFT